MQQPAQVSTTRRQHLLATAFFAAILVVVFYRAIFLGDVLASIDLLSKELPWRVVLPANPPIANSTSADVLSVFYPWKHFVHDELRAGRFPLWCKSLGCGYPLAGQGIIKLFGLTTAFLWFATPRVASLLSFGSQLWIGMVGMYALLYTLRLRWSAAVFGALTFGLNSAMFQHLEFEHVTGGLMFLPWICWALWRSADPERGGGRFLALAGLFFGLTVINASVQATAMVGVSSAGFTVAAMWQRQRTHWLLRSVCTIAGFAILGFTVGAVALLPNLELIDHNTRARFNHINWLELTWKRPVAVLAWLAADLNPDALGNTQTFDMLRGFGRFGTAALTPSITDLRVYCGLAAFVLAVLGLRRKGEVRTIGLTLVLVPLFTVVVTPLFLILYFRYLAAGACGIAVLAALGLERILNRDEQQPRDARRAVAVLAVFIALMVVVGAIVTFKRETLTRKIEQIGLQGTSFYRSETAWQKQKANETVRNFSLGGNAVLRFGVLAAMVAGLLAVTPRHAAAVAVACVALNTADLLEVSWRTFPSVPSRFEYPTTHALKFLQEQPGLFRVVSRWDAQTEPPTARPNMLMLHGLDDPRVYDSLVPPNPLLASNDWDGLNVRFMVVPRESTQSPPSPWRLAFRNEVDVYENLNAQPRVSFTSESNLGTNEAAGIQVDKYVSGEIIIHVTAARSGRLIVRERMYPGWQAVVDGRPVQITTADNLWQAVAVPAGKHAVTLRFQPGSVRWGAVLTLAGLLVTVVCWGRGAKGLD